MKHIMQVVGRAQVYWPALHNVMHAACYANGMPIVGVIMYAFLCSSNDV